MDQTNWWQYMCQIGNGLMSIQTDSKKIYISFKNVSNTVYKTLHENWWLHQTIIHLIHVLWVSRVYFIHVAWSCKTWKHISSPFILLKMKIALSPFYSRLQSCATQTILFSRYTIAWIIFNSTFDTSPYTHRKIQKATWQHQKRH